MKKLLLPLLLLPLFLQAVPVLAAAGDACDPNDPLACTGTTDFEECDATTKKCFSYGDVPADNSGAPSAAQPSPASTVSGAPAQGNDFVPLTTLPGITDAANTSSLAPFLTQVYKLAIGLAVVLAILQIMRAGVMYMGGDSITEKKEARNLIGVSIAGLLLVLSPVIVFNIINPNILKLNPDFTKLQSSLGHGTVTASTPAQPGAEADGPVGTPSTIDSTGAVNGGCHLFSSGAFLSNDGGSQQNSDEQCCTRQGPKGWVDWNVVRYSGETNERCVGTIIEHSLAYQGYFYLINATTFADPIGPVPVSASAYNTLKNTCSQIHGVFHDDFADGIQTVFSFHDCPANSGLGAPPKGQTYTCANYEAACKAK